MSNEGNERTEDEALLDALLGHENSHHGIRDVSWRSSLRNTATAAFSDLDSTHLSPQTAIQELAHAWKSQKHAPELLPYLNQHVSLIQKAIQQQSDMIDDLSSALHFQAKGSKPDHRILSSAIMQADLDRVRFILRAYLRSRLDMVCDFTPWQRSNLPW